MPLIVTNKMLDEQVNEKLIEMQNYLNKMEEEISKNEDANLATMGITFGKLQGIYKEIIQIRKPFDDDKSDID